MRRVHKTIVITMAAIFVMAPLPAFAHEGREYNSESNEQRIRTVQKVDEGAKQRFKEQIEAKKSEIRQKVNDKKNEARQKLDDKKREICNKREKTINTRMQHIVEMREKQVNHIGKIVDRVKEFYVKQGNAAADYDALIATVDSKRAVAVAALESAKTAGAFSCATDGPKADANAFKAQRDALVAAIRDYRTATKNLIVAVKTAQPAKEEQNS